MLRVGKHMKQKKTLHKKMKFSITDFFSKCGQIRRKLQIWSHLLKKSLMEKFIFCAVEVGDFVSICNPAQVEEPD